MAVRPVRPVDDQDGSAYSCRTLLSVDAALFHESAHFANAMSDCPPCRLDELPHMQPQIQRPLKCHLSENLSKGERRYAIPPLITGYFDLF